MFDDEVTQCPRCGACTHVHHGLHILEHLDLISDVVPIAPARTPPDDPVSELDFGA